MKWSVNATWFARSPTKSKTASRGADMTVSTVTGPKAARILWLRYAARGATATWRSLACTRSACAPSRSAAGSFARQSEQTVLSLSRRWTNSPGTGVRRHAPHCVASSRIDPMLFLRMRRASSDTGVHFAHCLGTPSATGMEYRPLNGARFHRYLREFLLRLTRQARYDPHIRGGGSM